MLYTQHIRAFATIVCSTCCSSLQWPRGQVEAVRQEQAGPDAAGAGDALRSAERILQQELLQFAMHAQYPKRGSGVSAIVTLRGSQKRFR